MKAVADPICAPSSTLEKPDGAFARFEADLARYFRMNGAQSSWEKARTVLQTESIWGIAVYRLGRFLREEASLPARALLRGPFAVLQLAARLALGIYLDPAADIGAGLYIGHSGGIWVAPQTRMGSECNLSHAVTIGVAGNTRRGAPCLGDRVWVGTKATIAGPVTIGSGAVIGANSLVTCNVPENAVVVGVPARVLSFSGSAALL